MKKVLLIIIAACAVLAGCNQRKSAAEKAAEEAQLRYEQTLINNAQTRIVQANEELEAAGLTPLDTAAIFSTFRMLHGKDLEENIRLTLEAIE